MRRFHRLLHTLVCVSVCVMESICLHMSRCVHIRVCICARACPCACVRACVSLCAYMWFYTISPHVQTPVATTRQIQDSSVTIKTLTCDTCSSSWVCSHRHPGGPAPVSVHGTASLPWRLHGAEAQRACWMNDSTHRMSQQPWM